MGLVSVLLPSTRASARRPLAREPLDEQRHERGDLGALQRLPGFGHEPLDRLLAEDAGEVGAQTLGARGISGRISTGAALSGSTTLMGGSSLLDGVDGRAGRGCRCGR